jgi:geranylgeranyl diphosphate synthase, type II
MSKGTSADNFENYILENPFKGEPSNLYDAMNYIMQLGGKRMRPKLLLLSYQACGGNSMENAYHLALAIETFHNFSLVHDDIMDNAPIRRGKKTLHEVYDVPTAVLAGDNLFIKCFDLILNSQIHNTELLREFTKMASLVCDGQQMDMNLPTQIHILEEEYLKMIELKTAVLPACSLKMGAMAANASKQVADSFYQFGLNLGMAFQLQDDYLDCFGSEIQIGKQEGGDIIENKRTILYLHAEKNLLGEHLEEFKMWFNEPVRDHTMKIERVRELFRMAQSDVYLIEMKETFERKALEALQTCHIDEPSLNAFLELFNALKHRVN